MRAAEKLEVVVYGGDAIIRPDGSIVLIDLNDWPSYAPVRNEASKIIGETIINRSIEFTGSVESQYALNK